MKSLENKMLIGSLPKQSLLLVELSRPTRRSKSWKGLVKGVWTQHARNRYLKATNPWIKLTIVGWAHNVLSDSADPCMACRNGRSQDFPEQRFAIVLWTLWSWCWSRDIKIHLEDVNRQGWQGGVMENKRIKLKWCLPWSSHHSYYYHSEAHTKKKEWFTRMLPTRLQSTINMISMYQVNSFTLILAIRFWMNIPDINNKIIT